jgi:hypothetical protein
MKDYEILSVHFSRTVALGPDRVPENSVLQNQIGYISFDKDARFLRIDNSKLSYFDLIPLTNVSVINIKKDK